MGFNFPPFTITFVVGTIMALIIAWVVWMRRPGPGIVPFVIFALAVGEWVFARAFEAGAVAMTDKIFWGKTEYFGIAVSAICWLFFALDYTGITWWKRPRNFIPLCIFPAITLIVLWTNEYHGWIWPQIYPSPASDAVLVWTHGPWFWAYTVYNYSLMLIGMAILWRFAFLHKGIYRRQVVAIFIGTLIPLIGNTIYLAGLSPIKGLDITPFVFVLAGLVYAVSVFPLKFMDVVPVARGALVENMPDGIVVLDSGGSIVDMNPAAEGVIGSKAKGALGQRMEKVWWPWLEIVKADIDKGGHTELVSEKEGVKRYLDTSVTLLNDKKDQVAGKLVVIRDMTERRKIQQKLVESEARYSTLVEQSNEGVLIIQDGVYMFANRTMAELSGYTVEELVGKALPFGIAESDWDLVLERNRLRRGGQAVPDIYDIRIKHKGGQIIEVELSVGTILYEGHQATIITIRDITERKLTQRKLEMLYQEEKRLRNILQEEMDKRSKYTRALVHELKTPLTAILASGELLEGEINDPIHSALVQNIRRATLNLEQRINELIELARGEVGMLKIEPVPIDMVQIVREIGAEMGPVAAGKGLNLISEIPEALPLVLGDKSRLRQVLINLISNSLKYTFKGTVTLRASSYDEGSILVQVEDTGKGISKEQMEYLFDPYLRKSVDSERLGGLGIGLALSKMFVELHRGKIWAESTPGKGTVLSFTVPLYREDGRLLN
jgi:PAS domain S-box-containing protein